METGIHAHAHQVFVVHVDYVLIVAQDILVVVKKVAQKNVCAAVEIQVLAVVVHRYVTLVESVPFTVQDIQHIHNVLAVKVMQILVDVQAQDVLLADYVQYIVADMKAVRQERNVLVVEQFHVQHALHRIVVHVTSV